MRTRLLGLALALAALTGCATAPAPDPAPPARARITGTLALSARMVDLTVDSPALGRTAKVRLLLPARYAAEPARRWPVLFLLHGCCDTYGSWTSGTGVEELASDVLVAVPEGGPVGFYSDWVAGPRWEAFHLGELPGLLAASYRAGDLRAVAGVSMGGLGALGYAARHPGMFRAAASFSGVVHTRLAGAPARYRGLVRSLGEDAGKLWGDPDRDAAVWARHNPYDLAPGLRGTRLFVSCGTGEDPRTGAVDENEAALAPENAALAARLRELGIPATVDLYGPGTHSWPYWDRELRRAWPLLADALGVPAGRR